MPKVLTLTLSPTIDVSGEAEAVRPVRKVRTKQIRFDPGGGGINVARVVTLLGGDAEALYLGGGEVGMILDRLLTEKGIRTHRIAVDGQTRLGFIVHEQSTGLEYRFVPEGSPVAPESLKDAVGYVRSHPSEYVVGSGSLPRGTPEDFYAGLATDVAARGGRFVLDTSGAALRATLGKAKVYLVKPSLGELEQVVGRKLDADSAEEAAAEIVASGSAELVAVTLGADGAVLASRAGTLRLPTIPVRVRSATGAGDSFLAAMVCALLEGRSEHEAFRFGIAAGAAAAMTPGTELCRRQDVLDLFERCKAL